MTSHRLTFHLFQFASKTGEPLKTLQLIQKLFSGWTPKRGEWVVFPEMWPTGLKSKNLGQQQVENAFCFHWLKRFARTHQCYMAGSMLEMPKGTPYNSAYLIGPKGKLLGRYRKIHLFRLTGENLRYRAGNKLLAHKFPWGKLGLAICFDLRFPELFRNLTQKGTKVFLIPSAWPRERINHWTTLLKARAIENQCFVIGVNKYGKEKDGSFYGGHSAVFDPWGNSLGILRKKRGILTVKIDLTQVDKIRKKYPFLRERKIK